MRYLAAFFGLLLLAEAAPVGAYDPATHRQLATRSIDPGISRVDEFLRKELSLADGVSSAFPGVTVRAPRRVEQLIGDGALAEDSPPWRSLNHFHNPLIDPWDDAGLRAFSILDLALVRGQSSVLWQQNTDQPSSMVFTPVALASSGGAWSWQDARQRYLQALTRPRKEDREDEPGRDRAFGELFENLGHLAHLVQDAFVPAHARNDAHPPPVRHDWYEKWVEEARTSSADKFSALLNATPRGPAASIFTPTGNSRAPVPVARLLDGDTFRGLNADVLGEENTLIGAAEFTNGNFLSRGTLFRRFALPRAGSLDPGPIVEPSPGKFRRYFTKNRDGARVAYFATEGMLFDSLEAALAAPVPSAGWMLDDLVSEDYARLLLPRAVGYSAALLDYFFRGRLDVDVFDDGSGLRLAGTNASPDLLDGGTLTVYADGIDGVRRLASAAVAVGRVEAGGALPAVPVTPPPGAERFVAVYTGTLGDERAADTFKGGVIGKVLGGVRVEEVFSDGMRWQLRTPQGVFPLPIPAGRDNIVELRWGDADNTLVGRTDIGPDRPNLMLAYKVNRPPGSVTMPLLTQPDGSRVVDVQETSRKSFPVGLYLGTTIQFSHTIQYKRYLTTLVPTVEYEWNGSFYTFARVADVQARLDLVVNDARTLRRSDPVTLGWVTEPYNWYVAEIGLTADGKILALVGVWLTSPGDQGAVFSGPFDRPEEIPYEFPPMIGYTWALVNVTDGTVVGGKSTAPPDLVIDHTTTVTRGGGGLGWYTGETVIRYVGGAFPPPERREPGVFFAPGLCDTPPAQLLGTVRMQNETSAISVVQYRPEIAGQQFADPARLQAPDRTEYWVYLCGQPQSVGIAVTVRTSELTLSRLDTAFRAPGDGTGEQLTLLLLQSQPQLDYWDLGKILTWFPERTTAELRAELTRPALHYLQAASRQSALVITDVYEPDFDETTSLVALTGDPAVQVFATGLWDFRLLAPSYLYNPFDLKFYRLVPPLIATALPAALSGASGNPIGAYHAVRLP